MRFLYAPVLYKVHDALMRQKYFDPIERFPDRIDQLLEAINRVSEYMSQQIELLRM